MTAKQNTLYFSEWGAVRRVLLARRFTPAEANAMRHQLHVEALGEDRSHTKFSNRDFDLVLASFRGISRPDDVAGQVRLLEMDRTRHRHRVGSLLEELGKTEHYRDAIVARMAGEGGLSSCIYADLRVDSKTHGNELAKLIVALEKQLRREEGRDGFTAPHRRGTRAGAVPVGATQGDLLPF